MNKLAKLLNHFKLDGEKEDFESVAVNISNAVSFKGTNLWILIFAIFIASLGLNVNSTAVIIGAMLVSPLMGPIMGLGFGMGVNDLQLLKKSLFNYLLAAGVGLATSTIYFLISPINDAHSEILARTAPNIYDVLIAFFGGLAGILAVSSKNKGNVIPGVAIATALMPPLCTAGYGLATWQLIYFSGAFYLFIINTVFIALATLITVRLLRFPRKHLLTDKAETKAQRIVWVIVIITVLPSIYLGYDIVQQNRFTKKANTFIESEANIPNDYLLKKEIDAKKKTIILTYGGEKIADDKIKELKARLKKYGLENASLEIQQGFAYLTETNKSEKPDPLVGVLDEKELELHHYKEQFDSLNNQHRLSKQLFDEIHVQHPEVKSAIIQPSVIIFPDSIKEQNTYLVMLDVKKHMATNEQKQFNAWLRVRLKTDSVTVIYK